MNVDLRTRYLGIELKNPMVVSACPLTEDISMLQRLEEAGASAAVFPSLFEEQIEHEELEVHAVYESGAESFAEAMTYLPELDGYNVGPSGYLQRLERAKESVSIPVIGSLNGITPGGWVRYARLMQDAGADALELNVYIVAADPDETGGAIEQRYLDLVQAVREAVTIPLGVKVAPFFTSFASFAGRLLSAGADGLVLFNRFVHADIDLETLEIVPDLVLSESHESRLPMMWIALLRGNTAKSLAASSGIHSYRDVLKLLLVGADVTMTASSIYRRGPEHLSSVLDSVRAWMVEHEYTSVEQLKGSMSQEHCPDPGGFERVNYMKTLTSWSARAEK